MLNYWLYIGIFLVVAVVVPLVAVLLPVLIAPKKPSARKEEVYECGIESQGNIRIQFKSQYYIYALIFLVFASRVSPVDTGRDGRDVRTRRSSGCGP